MEIQIDFSALSPVTHVKPLWPRLSIGRWGQHLTSVWAWSQEALWVHGAGKVRKESNRAGSLSLTRFPGGWWSSCSWGRVNFNGLLRIFISCIYGLVRPCGSEGLVLVYSLTELIFLSSSCSQNFLSKSNIKKWFGIIKLDRSEFTFWLQPLTSQSPNLTETQFSCTNVMRIGWDIKSSVIPETINHYVHKTNGVRFGHSLYTKKEEWLR